MKNQFDPEIVDKYRKKVGKLEDEITKILHEEWEERVMQRAENQANRTEKLLKDGGEESTRSWFQSHKQRQEEKGKRQIFIELHLVKNITL